MCFTIEIHLTRRSIEERFQVDTSALYDFDFNYFYRAFSNPFIPVIAQEDSSQVQLMQWGLIPAWSRDREEAERIRKGTYNARSETLHEKPSFKEPLSRGRCLIIAGGFFEWQLINEVKIPWYISLKSGAPFVFAGLCDTWRDPLDGEISKSCSIITTEANPLMEKIHNTRKRMPVILKKEKETDWISGEPSLLKRKQLLQPFNESDLKAYTVTPRLSATNTDPSDPHMIEPYEQFSSGKLF
ncbi:MAG: SOS response-associated peptidase [Bacteroidales bacterium]|nr:SOS response-associated peptidase [Bacteroidales bacterium]